LSKNTYPRKILTKSTTKFKENFWCELKLYGKAFGMDLVKFFVVMDGSKIFGMVYGEISGMELNFMAKFLVWCMAKIFGMELVKLWYGVWRKFFKVYDEIFGMVYGEIPGMELKFMAKFELKVYGEIFLVWN
jgi:hypothetical protein